MINLASVGSEGGEYGEYVDAARIAAFACELGVLKRLRRAGWWHVGVRDPESVAEHSLRVAQLASLLAAQEGADPAHAAHLAIWHDSREARTGDIPHTAKPCVQGWIDTSRAALTTVSAQRIADAAIITSPLAWRDR